MAVHQHHHHSPGHHPHDTRVHASPSLLRLGALERLGLAAILIGALWLAIAWAMV